ncbi:MAG: hypothetical protein MPEBLZ_04349 [Candidatus Methanoperedens nitroreducens]|uniref:Uncharacterized protein n=1 Tax=Candidatus Methanoperedens nitratireducens TaxID=1392998 RepID=A0A0P7ZZQ1_9EURY|nr:hypothetical protein [Candidatus Methanoperedens sp. BLZ2]KAB2942423.1 MAG: hypothetical protein F9K14_17390 [Candidatus Methanoperedens sp.]KPQ41093.1 MAG: hypothetical protein MPEBLZ_04349 [Candidatus Methanoperedens sp. BLZ1]MBZ0176635.1 hypothetical protein [Candidatus Methanoperedens nitroreducens]MCX9080359.1 hypothetical protein [Candidatus Methanoperedens sp.]
MSKICPVCSGTGKCPICGNYKQNQFEQIKARLTNIDEEIFDLTHEKGRRGLKIKPKWIVYDTPGLAKHIQSLKSISEDLHEIID